MQYITRGTALAFQIKLNLEDVNTYSGTYNFSIKNVQTNQQSVLTLVDISTLKNIYSKFTLTSGQTYNLFEGQYQVKIYDAISATTTLIAEDRWIVNDTHIDNDIYFMQSDNNPVVFGIYTDEVPLIPILTLTLMATGIDVLQQFQEGSPNTSSFDVWRKLGTGGTYINTAKDIQSFANYDNNLNYNTEYYYKARAKNTVGYSSFTAEQLLQTINITGVSGSSIYTKAEINAYSATTQITINSKLNTSIFSTYTGTTAPGAFASKSFLSTYTGTTAPAAFASKSIFSTYTGTTAPLSFAAKVHTHSSYLGTGGTAVCATTAGNALALCNCTPSCFLGAASCAVDSAKLGGYLPAYFLNTGTTHFTGLTSTSGIYYGNTQNQYVYLNSNEGSSIQYSSDNKITIGNGSVSVNQAGGYQTILAYPTCVKIFSNSTGNCMLVGGCVNAAKFLEAGTCLVSKYAQTCALGTIAPYNIWTGSTASYASVTPKLNTTLYLVTS